MKKVSIVIPTYNHCDDLLSPCLESVLKYTDLQDVEIIIVANGCTDNTQDYLASKPVKLIWFDKPLGYTKATNEGIKAAVGQYIVTFNNDNVLLDQPKNRWIDLLLEPFNNDPSVAVTGPMKSFCPHAQREMIIFFCACIKREILDKFGLLDEVFSPGWGEDTDLCCKAVDAGYKIVQVCPSEKYYDHNRMTGAFPIYHKGGETLVDLSDASEIIRRNSQKLADRYAVKIEKATYCKGYMTDIELRWLAREAKKHRVVIEVGSWRGRSTRALGDNTLGVVYAVDHFNGSEGEQGWHSDARLNDGDFAFIDFCNNNFDLIQSGRIIPLRGTSMNMAQLLKKHGVKADMIFIDADHSYEAVKRDVETWQELLTDDGLLCGHDARAWAGVDRAISETLHQHYIGENTTIWFCEKKDVRTQRVVLSGSIFDCFLFNDEIELLEKRLSMLFDTVDRFVIVEGTRTFTNTPKLLHFRDNLDRFRPFLRKISHVVVDDYPLTDPWGMERHQRDSIMRGLTECKDNDVIIISDCDELPSVGAIKSYRPDQGIMALSMDLHYYNLNTKAPDQWLNAKMLPYGILKTVSPCGARYTRERGAACGTIPNGGKHLSFFGNIPNVVKKLEAYAHQEYNTPEMKNPERIRKAIEEGRDLFGREIRFARADRLLLDDVGVKHGTQKCSLCHNFLSHYEKAVQNRDVKVIVEIGIDQGASLRTWAEFFPQAQVYGFDFNPRTLINEGNIRSFLVDQSDPQKILDVLAADNVRPDLVVDDGSHIWSHQIETYETIFPMMRRGSIYIAEDLHTSFIPEYRDRGEGQLSPLKYFSAKENFVIVETNNRASITGIGIKG